MDIRPCTSDTPRDTPLALQQHPHYLRTVQRMGGAAHSYVIRDGADQIARVQVLKRKFWPAAVNWIARGPVWTKATTSQQKRQALHALCHALPRSALTLAAPDDTEDAKQYCAQRFRALITPQYMAELDLTQSAEARLAAQHGKWRNRLRRAQSQGGVVSDRPFCPDRDGDLLALENAQRRLKRYRALPTAFTLLWAKANPCCTRLFFAQGTDGVQAFILVLLHAPTATYHIGWTGNEGRKSSAHTLLLWSASNWLAQRHYLRFDLGPVDTQSAPGLARFKIGSGATVRPLGPTMIRLGRPRLDRRIYPAT